jgi:hypothetical protein
VETLRDLEVVRALAPESATLIRAADDGGEGGVMPTMEIAFSKTNTWYEISSFFEGNFLERVAPGAATKTIKENRSNLKVLYDHGFDPQIGNKVLGPIDDVRDTPDGPVATVPLFDTSYNRDLLPGLEAGVYGSSMRFSVTRDEWNDEPGVSATNPKGIPERTIKEYRLYEFGPVTFPANPGATAGVRSATDDYYERLRSRDSRRVDDLTARVRAIRTPEPAAVRQDTADNGAANPEAVAPTASHPTGLSPTERRERLIALSI